MWVVMFNHQAQPLGHRGRQCGGSWRAGLCLVQTKDQGELPHLDRVWEGLWVPLRGLRCQPFLLERRQPGTCNIKNKS